MKDEKEFELDDDFDFDEQEKPIGEKIIRKQSNNLREGNEEFDFDDLSRLVIEYIKSNIFVDDVFETSEFPDFVDYLDKNEILKLPISSWFSYEVARGDKKDKLKFIVWAQNKILLSDKINDFAKVEILKIFNVASALTMFRKIEWQIATV